MQTIYIDISNKSVVPTIYAKQGDVGRKFQVVLTDSGLPYIPVSGSAFSVWYKGASGEGNYTDIGDKSAFSLNGNKVEIEMIVQMLSAHGDGILCLTLNSPDGNQISSWNIPYMCEIVPGSESEKAEEYYTAFSKAVEELPYPDETLSIKGKAADATAVGEALAKKADISYTKKIGNPHNLLDNSDFRNPVNQREYVSGTEGAANYTIDRWWLQYNTYLFLHSDCIGISGFWNAEQPIGSKLYAGRTYTFGIDARGNNSEQLFLAIGDSSTQFVSKYFANISGDYKKYFVSVTLDRDYDVGEIRAKMGINNSTEQTTQIFVRNAFMYEGEYTAETLPEYQPKGYGAELAECQRYFYAISGSEYVSAGYGLAEPYGFYPVVNAPVPMRTRPTVTYSGNWTIWDGSSAITITSLAVNAGATANKNCAQLSLTIIGGANLTAGNMYFLTVRNDRQAYMWFSADL